MSTVRGIVRSSTRRSLGRTQSRLDSWKEIAVYLRREVRTVQRWERFEGLPVRRLFHNRASSVYAFANELDAWLETRSLTGANSILVKDSSNPTRFPPRNDLMRSAMRCSSPGGHARVLAPRHAPPVSIGGKVVPKRFYVFSERRSLPAEEMWAAQMSFFVACLIFERLARSGQFNFSLNLVLVGAARGASSLQNIRIEEHEVQEDKCRELPN